MSKSSIRTAVIGYGLAGRVFHAPFVAAVPGFELATIVQRRGDEAMSAYPQARIDRSAGEAISDPDIELVVVATPNVSHFELASEALKAGKHVVIDKPFATTSTDALQLIELAKTAGKMVFPFHNRRYDGDFLTLRKLHADGLLGRWVTVESRFDRFRPLQRPGSWKETGGVTNGILFDLGPHLVDQALALFGAPRAITASSRTDRDRTDIDDAFDITLEFGDENAAGLRYNCHATLLAADPSPRFLVHGTRGSYCKSGLDPQEAASLKGMRPPSLGSAEPWLPEAQDAWGTLTLALELSEPVSLEQKRYPTVTGDYRQFYAGVRDAIRHGASPPVPAGDGYRVVRLLELARESSVRQTTLPVTFADTL